MKRLLFVFVIASGCSQSNPSRVDLLSECFSGAAYEVIKAESSVQIPPEKQECCGKCRGGMVKSGDGLAWVPCPCHESCPCKSSGALIPPKTRYR